MVTRTRDSVGCGAAAAMLLMGAAAGAAESTDSGALQVEEIVVTATKRAAALQDIPISISAFTAEALESRGVVNLRDLNQVAPSLYVSSSASGSGTTTITLRGIGTASTTAGFEGAVGVFVDGVYLSRAGQAMNDLVAIERIEVLRGPQGTLYGKNTSAGAINIISAKPEMEFAGEASLSVGNYGARQLTATVTGPLVQDQLAFRLSGSSNERDGVLDDVVSGRKENDRDRWTLKGQLLWTPSADVTVRFLTDYTKIDEACCAAQYFYIGGIGAVLSSLYGAYEPPGYSGKDRDIALSFAPTEQVEDFGFSTEINWDMGWAQLTSILSSRQYEVDRAVDPDHSNAPLLQPLAESQSIENRTAELRLAGKAGAIDWLVGGFFSAEDIDRDDALLYDSGGGSYAAFLSSVFFGNPAAAGSPADYPGRGIRSSADQEADGWALFTHNIWHLGARTDLALGLRYTREEKSARNIINDAPVGTFVNDDGPGHFCNTPYGQVVLDRIVCNGVSWDRTRDEDATTGGIALSHYITPEINGYVSYSRGYKAGGFNLDRESLHRDSAFNGGGLLDTVEFGPESVDAYELGVKTELFDRRASLNAALFYEDYQGYQQQLFNGVFFKVSNLDKIISQGVELDGNYVVMPGVTAHLGVSYTDAHYAYDGPLGAFKSGDSLLSVPDWQGSAAVNVNVPLTASLRALANIDVGYFGAIKLLSPNTRFGSEQGHVQDGYALVNLQLGVGAADESWRVVLWGRNLTDEVYYTRMFQSVYQYFGIPALDSISGFVGDPRTYGLKATIKF